MYNGPETLETTLANEISYFIKQKNNILNDDRIQRQYKEKINSLLNQFETMNIADTSLEETNERLDEINSLLIKTRILASANRESLSIDRLNLTRFPETLFQEISLQFFWQNLKTLYCNNNQQLRALPESLGKCQALQYLYCHHNQLSTLPASLGKCQALESINFAYNQLRALPESLKECQKLKGLYCNNNQFSALPEFLGEYQDLRDLDFSYNQLHTLPKSLGKYQVRLQYLNFAYNQLCDLPAFLGGETLQELYFSHNQLVVLPESLGECQALQKLDFSHNQLVALPDALNYQELQKLCCDNNYLVDLPRAVRERFGDDKCASILNNQKSRLHRSNSLTWCYNLYSASTANQETSVQAMQKPTQRQRKRGSV